MGKGIYALVAIIRTEGQVNRMSNDLISRKAFMEYLGLEDTEENREENVGEIATLEDFDRQPTAFDKEKVLEDLEALAEMESRNMNDEAAMAYTHAIGIVEKGGIE